MSKKKALTFLIILGVVGSFVTFYMANLILSDVSNMFYGVHDIFCISTVPGAVWIADIILAVLFVIRYYHRPQYRKKMIMTYTWIMTAFAIPAIAAVFYSAGNVYDSILAPYPYPGYLLSSLILQVLFVIAGFVIRTKVRKNMKDDEARRKPRFGYICYTILLCGLIFFSFDRFGALLWSPVYIHRETFYMTLPFYLSLLLPMALLVHTIFYIFGFDKKHPQFGIIYAIIILVCNVILAGAVAIIGTHNTLFISVISPALAIERLATLPIDTILHHAVVLFYGIYELRYSIQKSKGKVKKIGKERMD